jgi:thiol-disulfide isomerase/thioredoxin
MLLLAAPALAGVAAVEGGVEFTYEDPSAGTVNIAGNFNNWNMTANVMTQDEDGLWRAVVDLEPGEYEYKFVVNGSVWVADPENPWIVGDYGNSGFGVDEEGEVVIKGGATQVSNTALSSRVAMTGFSRTILNTRSISAQSDKWRLDRPTEMFNLDVTATLRPELWGTLRLQMNTARGVVDDNNQIEVTFYKAMVNFEDGGGDFRFRAYYNEEIAAFNDLFELVGHRDLEGTIREEHIKFGEGTQGLVANLDLFDSDITAIYSEVFDADITDQQDEFGNTGTDFLAGRVRRGVGPVDLGLFLRNERNGWWVDFTTGTNTHPAIAEYMDVTDSDWFEIGTSDWVIAGQAATDILKDRLRLTGEYGYTSLSQSWDAGNREEVVGTNLENGELDIPICEDDGYRFEGQLDVTHRGFLGTASHERRFWNGMDEELKYEFTEGDSTYTIEYDPEFVAFGTPAYAGDVIRTYTSIGNVSNFGVNVFGALPERTDDITEVDLSYALENINVEVEVDWLESEWAFADTCPDCETTAKRERLRFSPRVHVDLLDQRLMLGVESEIMDYDEDEFFNDYNTTEIIGLVDYNFYMDFWMLSDLRYIKYESIDAPDTLAIDEDFFAPYIAFAYRPRENIELKLSYGVDPLNYDVVVAEGRGNGRERWRREYMWENSDASVLDAEKALEDTRQVSLVALITF